MEVDGDAQFKRVVTNSPEHSEKGKPSGKKNEKDWKREEDPL